MSFGDLWKWQLCCMLPFWAPVRSLVSHRLRQYAVFCPRRPESAQNTGYAISNLQKCIACIITHRNSSRNHVCLCNSCELLLSNVIKCAFADPDILQAESAMDCRAQAEKAVDLSTSRWSEDQPVAPLHCLSWWAAVQVGWEFYQYNDTWQHWQLISAWKRASKRLLGPRLSDQIFAILKSILHTLTLEWRDKVHCQSLCLKRWSKKTLSVFVRQSKFPSFRRHRKITKNAASQTTVTRI